MDFTVLIPARLASTRLPGKPLADIGGVPMVVRVAQRALQSSASRVVVACDSVDIMAACDTWGISALLTRTDHASGSDRLAEACALLELPDDHVVVNVQGDEPLITPGLINDVAGLLQSHAQASMGTAAHPVGSVEEFLSPHVVKVVTDKQGLALYFSRAPISWWRDGFADGQAGLRALPAPAPLRHIGIYSYRAGFLRLFPALQQAPMEVTEALEQLRAQWHGYRIAVHVTRDAPGPGVDTAQDLERVRQLVS